MLLYMYEVDVSGVLIIIIKLQTHLLVFSTLHYIILIVWSERNLVTFVCDLNKY